MNSVTYNSEQLGHLRKLYFRGGYHGNLVQDLVQDLVINTFFYILTQNHRTHSLQLLDACFFFFNEMIHNIKLEQTKI